MWPGRACGTKQCLLDSCWDVKCKPLPTAGSSAQASEWREGASAAGEPTTGSTAGVGQYSSVGNKIKGVIPGTWARPYLLSTFLNTRALVSLCAA